MRRRAHHADQRPRVGIGYARVSTSRQADEGVSLAAQIDRITAMATAHDITLLDVIEDAGESAKTLDRPGMQRVLRLVEARAIDAIVIAKLDRATRSVKDLADLLDRCARRRVALISVAESLDTSSAAGRLVLNIMVSVGQWEREAISERTRDALAHQKALGLRTGQIPYGFALGPDGRHLVEHPAEQATLRVMRELRASGLSYQAVADELNRRGVTTRKGGRWMYQYLPPRLRRLKV